mmetsp:Transcript_37745/g.108281  ORF Transcript_37745/g.108281 Transcript_37745/m.108281 type:complete len:107 (-) Transcript_37745:73-393(-)
MIVFAGVLVFTENISRMQGVGFAIQLVLIAVYTLAKSFPKEFENGIGEGLFLVLLADVSGRQPLAKGLPSSDEGAGKDYGALAEAGALPDSAAGCKMRRGEGEAVY